MSVNPIPEGYHTVTPYLIVENAAGLIDFVRQAFGAEELGRMPNADGTIAHAEIKIGDSRVMLSDATGDFQPMPAMLHLYVGDVDAVYRQAVAAGATPIQEPADQFYGDRSGGVKDGFGNQWWIATHVEDVPPEEMEERARAAA